MERSDLGIYMKVLHRDIYEEQLHPALWEDVLELYRMATSDLVAHGTAGFPPLTPIPYRLVPVTHQSLMTRHQVPRHDSESLA